MNISMIKNGTVILTTCHLIKAHKIALCDEMVQSILNGLTWENLS